MWYPQFYFQIVKVRKVMARGKGTKKASIEETGESVKETAGPPAKKKKTDTTGSQNTKRVDLVKVAIEHCTS